MAAAPDQRIRQALEPVVVADGLLLDDVAVRRAGVRSVVEVVLDLPEDDEGVLDLDRIAGASRLVSEALDQIDLFPGGYTLEVSSRGVARPLTERRHFVRAIGRSVVLSLADGSTLAGRITAVERDGAEDVIVVVPVTSGGKGRRPTLGAPVRVSRVGVLGAHVEVDLSGLGDEDPDAAAGWKKA